MANYSGASISDPLLFSLYAGNGVFSDLLGQVSATATLANNTYELLQVDFASTSLTPGSQYTLVVTLPGQALPVSGGPGTYSPTGSGVYSQVGVIINSVSNSYPGGQFFYFGGSYSESFFASWDLAFNVMPAPAVYPEPQAGTFGAVNVGSTSSTPLSMAFEFGTAETLGPTAVLTQGATGLDFANAGTGTCTAGTAYTAGETCTVNVSFAPTVSGPRYGAAELLDGSGNVLATGYVQGTGVAPQVGFRYTYGSATPPVAISSADITYSDSLTFDSAGDLFLTDSADANVNLGNGSVVEFPASGSGFGSPIFFATGLPNPQGLAMDGAGNIFVLSNSDGNSDPDSGGITEYVKTASGYAAPVTLASELSYPNGFGIDGKGDLFFATNYDANNDANSGSVAELPRTSTGYSSPVTLASGLSFPSDVAVDGAGNVFVAIWSDYNGDVNSGSVLELNSTSNGYSPGVTIASGLNASGVGVDPSGTVFVASIANITNFDAGVSDPNSGILFEIPVIASGYGAPITLASAMNYPTKPIVDSAGNILVTTWFQNVYELPRHTAPSLAFASTPVGSTSSDSPQTVTVANIGNAPLTLPIPSTGNNPSISANFALDNDGESTCPQVTTGSSEAGTLAAGANCLLPISFVPASTGSISGSLTLTDDNLNAAGPNYATQAIQLSGTGTAASTRTPAALISPVPGSMFTGPSVTFTWTAPTGATWYDLWLGSTGVGSNNVYDSGAKTATTVSVTGLPTNGETIYTRLFTAFNGVEVHTDYTYTATAQAALTSPAPGSTLTGPSATFTWSAATGATWYDLWLGTTGAGSNNLYDSGQKTGTSVTATGLPTNGETIYARLFTAFNGAEVHTDYTYTADTQAALTLPAPGSTLTGPSATFTWTAATGATWYDLWLGSTGVGSNNLGGSGATTATSATFGVLPTNGETIYARLFTNFNGVEVHTDYTYTADTQAALTSPAPGSTLAGPSATFTWTAAAGATGYDLWLGTTGVGSNNLYDSGLKTGTSATVTGLPTNGETIYARLFTFFNGVEVHTDYTYTAQ